MTTATLLGLVKVGITAAHNPASPSVPEEEKNGGREDEEEDEEDEEEEDEDDDDESPIILARWGILPCCIAASMYS